MVQNISNFTDRGGARSKSISNLSARLTTAKAATLRRIRDELHLEHIHHLADTPPRGSRWSPVVGPVDACAWRGGNRTLPDVVIICTAATPWTLTPFHYRHAKLTSSCQSVLEGTHYLYHEVNPESLLKIALPTRLKPTR